MPAPLGMTLIVMAVIGKRFKRRACSICEKRKASELYIGSESVRDEEEDCYVSPHPAFEIPLCLPCFRRLRREMEVLKNTPLTN